MPPSLREILRSTPDHRRREGMRFDPPTKLLCAIVGMAAGADAHRYSSSKRRRFIKNQTAPGRPPTPDEAIERLALHDPAAFRVRLN